MKNKTLRVRKAERECNAITKKHSLEYHIAVVPKADAVRIFVWSEEHGFIDGHTLQGDLETIPPIDQIPRVIDGMCERWYQTLPKH